MQSNQSDQVITLIGAGLVGSLLAVLLAKRGFKVEIFERRPDMRRHDISAGRSINLALANRGIYPLQQAGLMDKVEPILTTMKGRMVHDIEGNQNFQSYGQREQEVIYSVSRADLNKICLDAAEETGLVTIHFDTKCSAVDFDTNQIQLQDEKSGTRSSHFFHRVIGTDGSASAVRDAIHQKASNQLDILPLGHSYKELRIPPGENGSFLIDKNALHIWPRGGFMLIALPNEDGSFTVTLFMPSEGELSFASLNDEQSVLSFFQEFFPNTLPLLPNLVDEFFNNPTGKLATVKCNPWHYQDLGLILGDAAHAIVPFHGQGMNCGFEDAMALAELIDEQLPLESSSQWAQVFAKADLARKKNGDAIADMAIENYVTMRDSVRDEKFLLKSALAFELERRFPQRFCPRYSMVMFHRLPYSQAKERGAIQEQILSQLTASITAIEEVDFDLARQLIESKLTEVQLNP